MNKEEIKAWFEDLQDRICLEIEQVDAKSKFQQDNWNRSSGGGGRTRILQNGNVIEKGGVNFSAVHGPTPKKVLSALNLADADFFATGISIVMHPLSPMVPIIHMNVRYFEMSNGVCWFGGGIDLTPHYVIEKDAQWFHLQLKKCCDDHHHSYYPKFKKWADDYFFIKHRRETRGIGGIFFDQLSQNDEFTLEDRWHFVKSVGNLFAPMYSDLINRNRQKHYSDLEKSWQHLRRGRYVEFNLVYDKGTKFGLDTDGRAESILMSLPPQANWLYDFKPKQGSAEEKTLNLLRKDINWAASK